MFLSCCCTSTGKCVYRASFAEIGALAADTAGGRRRPLLAELAEDFFKDRFFSATRIFDIHEKALNHKQ